VDVRLLDLDATVLRALAVAGAHPSTDAMTQSWDPCDEWLRLGVEPEALLRVGPGEPRGRTVREIVRIGRRKTVAQLLADAAAGSATTLWFLEADPTSSQVGPPTVVHTLELPWPKTLELPAAAAALVTTGVGEPAG
jgi:hypothetical protein